MSAASLRTSLARSVKRAVAGRPLLRLEVNGFRSLSTSSSRLAKRTPTSAAAIPLRSSAASFTYRKPHVIEQRRTFIATERTPNEHSLKFVPGKPVLPEGTPTLEYLSAAETSSSPLARELFSVDGVKGVMYGQDFITITKDPDTPWQLLKPDILNAITDHFATEEPVVLLDDAGNVAHPQGQSDTAILPDDSDTVAMIKELLETRVRPSIQEDGGDIEYKGFENGIVKLRLRGACRTCDSSVVTLKSGIENMLMHYIPEVAGVEQAYDEEEAIGMEEFKKLEQKLSGKGTSG